MMVVHSPGDGKPEVQRSTGLREPGENPTSPEMMSGPEAAIQFPSGVAAEVCGLGGIENEAGGSGRAGS